ncbi:type IV pilus assembly protein PilE [Pseudoalteromonas citrea]|uniref:Type IV pilus assembly protein PilE n=2 Tax=Pseudoalteromonas citrea TaxID=43655 RepID=A0AAD4AGW7_9GAMM|nr:type IV pilin protein [Pseudoalteromonas citrea]KAF7768909.1 type IV pilus assembly protein PilE [Pseudoalteromonas citrea]
MQIRSLKGFTLTELLISVLIVAVLGSLALPSYFQYVQESRRSEAQQKMLQIAAILERIYSRNGGYPDSGIFPISQTADGYDFVYEHKNKHDDSGETNSLEFSLSAKPKAGGPQATDKCGTLTLNHQGIKGPVDNDCW